MITTINEYKSHLENNEPVGVKFKTFPEIEDDLKLLGKDELTDEDTGLTFNNEISHHRAWVDVKKGRLENWNFAIYSNGEQIMIHGNPENGMGEIFHVIEGDLEKAKTIAKELLYNGVIIIENKKSITEEVSTDNIVKALDDIDERRPNRMKRPPKANYNDYAGSPYKGSDGVYIQDEAEQIMQDKYGKERGTRMWQNSIGQGARGNAMFKVSDDIMKEKIYLMDELNVSPGSYWKYSYYDLWKKWMDKIGKSYKVDSEEEVKAKKAEKQRLKEEEEKARRDKKLQDNIDKVNTSIDRIKDKYSDLELDNYKPDAKDLDRIKSLMGKENTQTQAEKMANAIKNKTKAIKRGLAVLDYLKNISKPQSFTYFDVNDLAKPFFNKAMNLNESHTVNEGKDAICGSCGEHGYDDDLDRPCSNCDDFYWTQDFENDEFYDDEEMYIDYDDKEIELTESKLFTSINEFKNHIIKENTDMLHINLLDRYKDSIDEYREKFNKFKHKIDGFKETNSDSSLKIGDIIEFTSGYNDDIRYTTEILGFDEDDDIYLLWESYWAPIRNDEVRDIKLVNQTNESNMSEEDTLKERIHNLKLDIQSAKETLKIRKQSAGGMNLEPVVNGKKALMRLKKQLSSAERELEELKK